MSVSKEYLQNLGDGTYKLVVLDSVVEGYEGLIEVPEGAESYSTDSMLGNKIIKFFKPGFIFLDGMWMRCNFQHTDADILWQRHTQPEELPFIDDEPTLDKVKIKVNGDLNQAIKIAKDMGYYNCQFDKIPQNAYWLLCNESGSVDYSMNENILNEYAMLHIDDEPKSLNDQYAEIDKVRQAESLPELKIDNVNHPKHYNKGGVECISAIQASMSKESFCGYLKGNIVKYMWRYEDKGGVESLQKAQWYLNKLIENES